MSEQVKDAFGRLYVAVDVEAELQRATGVRDWRRVTFADTSALAEMAGCVVDDVMGLVRTGQHAGLWTWLWDARDDSLVVIRGDRTMIRPRAGGETESAEAGDE